jgi:hypothetical protein
MNITLLDENRELKDKIRDTEMLLDDFKSKYVNGYQD